MRRAFRPDVVGSPEIEVEPDIFRGPRVYVDGRPVPARRERGRPFFAIPMADGSERPLRLGGAFLGLRAVFEGREYPIERRLTLWETFLVLLPLAVVTLGVSLGSVGGAALGGLTGGIGVGVDLAVVRRPWPLAVRTLLAFGVTVVGYLAVALIGGAP